jgi:hypothetical protein
MTMIEAIKAFEDAAQRGAGSAEFADAVAAFAKVDVETLEDVSSIIAIAVEVVRAGHVETGLTMIERGRQVLDERLRGIRPPQKR